MQNTELMKHGVKERTVMLDYIKGFAIILVIIGHSIQYGSGINFLNSDSFPYEKLVFKVIYSFHMPLFMVVSGYLFFNTINRYSVKQLLSSRITKLVVPVFVWVGLFLIFHFTVHLIHHSVIRHETVTIDFVAGLKNYIGSSFQSFWFLWAVFWCSLLVILTNKLFNDSVYAYLVIFILTFITPDLYGAELYKFMFPFFLSGYFFNKRKDIFESVLSKVKQIYLLLIVGVAYLFVMQFYKQSSYIYDRGFTVLSKDAWTQIGLDFYMIIVGLIGTVLVLLLVNYVLRYNAIKKTYIANLGINSMGIYIVSSYLLIPVHKLTKNLPSSFLLTFIETILILAISYLIIEILKKFKLANRLLLGGR